MTTDTIPEAQKLAEQIRHSDSLCNNEDEMASLISKACIFYHKRKSQELQKQCEALETALADWHRLADQRSEALIKAQRQCEELDRELVACAKSCEEYGTKCRELRQQTGNLQQCASCGETKYTPVRLDSLGGYVCLSCVLKERDDLRTRAEKAEAALAMTTPAFQDLMNRCHRATQLAERAEAEVAELKSWIEELKASESGALTQLQQDVRPLVEWMGSKLCQCDHEGCVEHRKALETFLAKHPELKP